MKVESQTKKIKRWAFEAEITFAEIARQAKCSRDLVSKVIRGQRGTGFVAERVIEVLKERGCPQELLEWEPDRGGDQQAA